MPGLVFSDAYIPSLPWTGSPPIILFFKRAATVTLYDQTTWIITLGICTTPRFAASRELSERIRDDLTNSGEAYYQPHRPVNMHYAAIQRWHFVDDVKVGLESRLLDLGQHSCERDHLDLTLISKGPEGIEWPIRREIVDGPSIRFRPAEKSDTTAGPVTLLEVDIFDDKQS